jgi:hypothetical protein
VGFFATTVRKVWSTLRIDWKFYWRLCQQFPYFLQVIYRLKGIDDKVKLVVPCMLPRTQPETAVEALWPKTIPENYVEYGRIYRFDFLPLGFFSRVIFQLLELHPDDELMWSDGILLKKSQQSARADYDPRTFQLFVRVRMPRIDQSSTLLTEVIEKVDSVIAAFYASITVTRTVPCTHCLNQYSTPENCTYFTLEQIAESLGTFYYIQSLHDAYHALGSEASSLICNDKQMDIYTIAPDIAMANVAVIKDVQITKVLGQGGFGKVYKGIWNETTVAVKELLGEEMEITDYLNFRHEVAIMSQLLHPNLVRLYGILHKPLRMVLGTKWRC